MKGAKLFNQWRIIAIACGVLAWCPILAGQTSGEAPFGAYSNISGDTILFREGEELQYRRMEDKKWRSGRIEKTSAEGMTLDKETVKWEELKYAKGYLKPGMKSLSYGTGKGFLIAFVVIIGLLGVILALGLLGGSPIYIILPKVVGLSIAFLLPYLIILGSVIGPRFRRIMIGTKWKIIQGKPVNTKS